ncbi:hypothetical protein JCM3774_002279 [Rhodotorula dairenensis]
MSDAFFSKPRPFSKRKRDDAPGGAARAGRHGTSARGQALSRGGKERQNGRGGASAGGRPQNKGKRRAEEDDEDLDEAGADHFDSDDIGSDDAEGAEEEASEEDDELETPAQKRLRLSQMYLKSLEKDKDAEEYGFDAADLDRDIIAERLQQDVLEHTGKLHLNVASTLQLPIPSTSVFRTPAKGHRGCVTSAVASHDGRWLYTSSKDGAIMKYDLAAVSSFAPSSSTSSGAASPAPRIARTAYMRKAVSESQKRDGEKHKRFEAAQDQDKGKGKEVAEGHTDEILDLAISHDGRTLASAGRDKVIGCWNVEGDEGKWTRGLGGHKDAVGSIAFRLGTTELYSSSFDRTVKVFDLSTLSYIETLFGHQDSILSIDALRGEMAVTAGGRDKTVRFWKVMEESQLVFRGGGASRMRNVLDGALEDDGVEDEERKRRRRQAEEKGPVKFVEGSIDCVAMVDDSTLLSGGDSGTICLWTITKKKPIFRLDLAHGINEHVSETEGVIGTPRWITALSCLPYGDVFGSGSWDGQIRLWKIDERLRSFSPLATIPAPGFVNSIQLVAPSLRPTRESQQSAVSVQAGKGSKKGSHDAEAAGSADAARKNLLVVAATSKEPRLGRWMRFKDAKDGAVVAVIPMQ